MRISDWSSDVCSSDLVWRALGKAHAGPVEEGSVGAGTGTQAFGWKGGIGTSSRVLPAALGGWTVGVLVQTNYGGVLQVLGAPVGRELGRYAFHDVVGSAPASDDGKLANGTAGKAACRERGWQYV